MTWSALAAGAAFLLVSLAIGWGLTRLGGAMGLILRENYVSVVACQEMNEALERQDSAALFAASELNDKWRKIAAFDPAKHVGAGLCQLLARDHLRRRQSGLERLVAAARSQHVEPGLLVGRAAEDAQPTADAVAEVQFIHGEPISSPRYSLHHGGH